MAERERKEPERPVVRASARYVRIAPRKARLVADQVRGLSVPEARTLLDFSGRGAARDIAKLIASAAANAENNHELVAEDMRIAEIQVDEGPTLKRWRARARGRVNRIFKRTCHITIKLGQLENVAPAGGRGRRGKAASAAAPKARKRQKKKEVAA